MLQAVLVFLAGLLVYELREIGQRLLALERAHHIHQPYMAPSNAPTPYK